MQQWKGRAEFLGSRPLITLSPQVRSVLSCKNKNSLRYLRRRACLESLEHVSTSEAACGPGDSNAGVVGEIACFHQLTIPPPRPLFSAWKESTVTSVQLLWHGHDDEEKLIGVYATKADAVAAKERLR